MHLSTLWKTQFVSIYYFLGVDISGNFGVLPEIFFKKRFVMVITIWELPQKCGKRKNARNERETHFGFPLKTPLGNVENFFCGKPFLPVSACEFSC